MLEVWPQNLPSRTDGGEFAKLFLQMNILSLLFPLSCFIHAFEADQVFPTQHEQLGFIDVR